MKKFNNGIGTAIGFLMVTVFTGGIAALVLDLATEDLPAIGKIGGELRCMAGIPAEDSACVGDKLRALEKERDAAGKAKDEARAQRDELERQIAAYEARQRELAELGQKVENFNLFQTEDLPFGTVTTGAKFASVLEPEIWSDAWCYLQSAGRGAADNHVTLGHLQRGQAVVWSTYAPEDLREAGLNSDQFAQAKAACNWPVQN